MKNLKLFYSLLLLCFTSLLFIFKFSSCARSEDKSLALDRSIYDTYEYDNMKVIKIYYNESNISETNIKDIVSIYEQVTGSEVESTKDSIKLDSATIIMDTSLYKRISAEYVKNNYIGASKIVEESLGN